ncbi:hypothetical protein B1R94_00230 [Mycolicibacterium litorale]|nr:hypothetical protein B1R94_00230 [Mycolicibacterium litorale]
MDAAEVVRLYGPWKDRTPQDAATLLHGYSGRWWIAGGWAIDAFVRAPRAHGDLDIGIPRAEVDGFIEFVGASLDVWAAAGSLTPLVHGRSDLPVHCGNLWLRVSGAHPWEYDIQLNNVDDWTWRYKRNPNISRPLTDCLWSLNGITYLRPEVQLLHKAKHLRDKDILDFQRCLPLLDESSRVWLAESLLLDSPRHSWLTEIATRPL